MKSHSLYFLIFILFLSLSSKAQNYLEMPVSIQVNNGSVTNVLSNLEMQLHFNFSYEAQLITENKKISINEQNKPLKKVLNKFLNSEFEYKVVGTHVIIQSSIPPIDKHGKSFSFAGQVVGPDNEPLKNVIVYEANRQKAAFTSYDGNYNFTIRDKNHPVALNISSSGFRDTIIYVSQGQTENVLNISLSEQRLFGSDLKPIERQEVSTLTQIETQSVSDIKLVKFMVSDEALYMSDNLNVFNWQTAQVSLLPFVGTNDLMNGRTTNNVSLNVIAGYTAGIRGVEFGAVANIIQNSVSGVQAAGVSNVIGKNVNGFQAAGVANMTLGNLKGAQFSGVINLVKGHHTGIMVSGVVNITEGGNNNPTVKGIKMQLSGVTNIHKKDTANIQISAVYNDADNVFGAQLSAVSNFTNQKTKGIQLSTLFNYSNTLEGIQFGIVNVADTIKKGVQIGLINIVKNGYKKLELSSNETFFINAAYKTGGNHLYSFITGGYGQFINAGYGLGYITNHHEKISANIDLMASAVLSSDSKYSIFNGALFKFQFSINYKIARHLTVSVGPSFNIFNVEQGDDLKIPTETPSRSSLFYGSHYIDKAISNQKNQNWYGWHCSLRF